VLRRSRDGFVARTLAHHRLVHRLRNTWLVATLLQVMTATAFITGGVGFILGVGSRDPDISWYPRAPGTTVAGLLSVAALAAAIAFVTWVFMVMT
jgi:hypothetical protein